MPLYRRDYEGPTCPNGARPFYASWMGGPTLAAILNCPRDNEKPGAVYITGEPDTYFSQPAVTRIGRRYARGFIMHTDKNSGFTFTPHAHHDHICAWRVANRFRR